MAQEAWTLGRHWGAMGSGAGKDAGPVFVPSLVFHAPVLQTGNSEHDLPKVHSRQGWWVPELLSLCQVSVCLPSAGPTCGGILPLTQRNGAQSSTLPGWPQQRHSDGGHLRLSPLSGPWAAGAAPSAEALLLLSWCCACCCLEFHGLALTSDNQDRSSWLPVTFVGAVMESCHLSTHR